MAREKFVKIVSAAVPLNVENVDTDQIIPARFLKATERKGFGDNLFKDWRYTKEGEVIADFPVNDKKYSGSILVAGQNFGCGSSREHAAWAIYDYGFNVVVSSFFADIFRNNSLNNGLLPVQVTPEFLAEIFETIEKNANAQFTVDLEAQTFTNNTSGRSESFAIDGYKRECLLNGYDDVDYLRTLHPEVEQYEKKKDDLRRNILTVKDDPGGMWLQLGYYLLICTALSPSDIFGVRLTYFESFIILVLISFILGLILFCVVKYIAKKSNKFTRNFFTRCKKLLPSIALISVCLFALGSLKNYFGATKGSLIILGAVVVVSVAIWLIKRKCCKRK